MKVKPKMMAFEDSTATAPDRLTGQKNIVAFRAVRLKKGNKYTSNHNSNEQGIKLSDLFEILFFSKYHIVFLVEWKEIEYNFGNYFDGIAFTAPKTGLYSFSATAQVRGNNDTRGYFYVNGKAKFYSRCDTRNNDIISLPMQTTLKLEKDDKVEVRYSGQLYEADYLRRTFFEGRFISQIEE